MGNRGKEDSGNILKLKDVTKLFASFQIIEITEKY